MFPVVLLWQFWPHMIWLVVQRMGCDNPGIEFLGEVYAS